MIPPRGASWAVAEDVAQGRTNNTAHLLQPPQSTTAPAAPSHWSPSASASSSRGPSPIIPPRTLAPFPSSSSSSSLAAAHPSSSLQPPGNLSSSPRPRPVSIAALPPTPSYSTAPPATSSPSPGLSARPTASPNASPRSSSIMPREPSLRHVSSGSSLRNDASNAPKADSLGLGRPGATTRTSTGTQGSSASGGVSISALRRSLYDPSAATLVLPRANELGTSSGQSLLTQRRASASLAVPRQDLSPSSPGSSPRATRLTPRKATGPTGLLGDDEDAEDGDEDDDDDEGLSRRRPGIASRNRLSMIDFLAAGPPELGLADPRRPSQPASAQLPGRFMSSGSSPSPRAVQAAAAAPRSASAGDRPPRLEPRAAAVAGPAASSSAPRMSELLDFLNDEPPPGVTGVTSGPSPASRRPSATEPALASSQPLRPMASPQATQLPSQPQRPLGRPGSMLSLSVRPADDRVTMFGSTHTSSHYSVSGRVVITVRAQAFLQELRSRQQRGPGAAPGRSFTAPHRDGSFGGDGDMAARSKAQARMSIALADEVAEQARTASAAEQQGDAALSNDLRAHELDIKSLRVSFTGYSLYCDHSGRFSALRLAEASEELLPNGCKIPLRTSPSPASEGEAASSPRRAEDVSRYESDFDLTIPGWLPASMISRFGATFYCLHAEVRFMEPGGSSSRHGPVFSSSFGSFGGAEGVSALGSPSAGPTPVPPIDTSAATLGNIRNAPASAPSGLEGARSASASQANGASTAGPSSALPLDEAAVTPASATSRTSKSWLGKRAKQLQLRAKASISPGPASPALGPSEGGFGSSSAAAGSSQLPAATPQTFAQRVSASMRPPKHVAPERDASGNLILRSDYIPILVRRCREVVPVPVARLALVDSQGAVPSDPAFTPAAQSTESAQPAAAQPTPATEPARAAGELFSPVPTPAQPATRGPTPRRDASPPSQPPAAPTSPAAPAQVASPPPVTLPPPPASRPRPELFPPAPSLLSAPSDPSKLAAMASQPAPPIRASSSGAIERPGRGGSSRRNGMPSSNAAGVPMRHFLHRPVLHPPADAGMEDLEGTGLPFALTLSVPSYVQVDGPNSDMLSFGVQIEVGRSAGWLKVQELGGLRLRDMELICEQSERHSSVPSRTFRHNFPVPPEPMVEPEVLPRFETAGRAASLDTPLRLGYDSELVDRRILLARSGRAPDGAENSVERYRVSVVGPPPSQTNRSPSSAKGKGAGSNAGKSKAKGKSKESEQQQQQQRNAGESREASGGAVRSASSTTAALMAASAAGGTGAMGASGGPAVARSAAQDPRPRPNQPVNGSFQGSGTSTPSGAAGIAGGRASASTTSGPSSSLAPGMTSHSNEASEGATGSAGDEASGSAAAEASERAAKKKQSRMSRAVQMAMRGISDFAIALADLGLDNEGSGLDGPGPIGHGDQRDGAQGSRRRSDRSGKRRAEGDEDAPRATYSFKGDDGHGVDLTKGRVRMTVNLPLVSSNLSVARGMGWPQLVADYEAPYLRIKHKLKVKLGFGFGQMPLGGDGLWGQALVMCVPVRFTDSPPKEVKEQFAPQPLPVLQGSSEASAATAAAPGSGPGEAQPRGGLQPPTIVSGEGAGSAIPAVLPAYTQLFNEDGSRLADDGEDLPQYPGPPRPQLPHRGSVTAPSPRPNTASPTMPHGFGVSANRSVADIANAAAALTHASLVAPGAAPMSPVVNRIAPSRVVDEGFGLEGSEEESGALGPLEQARRELAELQADEEEEEHQHSLPQPHPQVGVVGVEQSTMMELNERIDETVDMDDDDADADEDGEMDGDGDVVDMDDERMDRRSTSREGGRSERNSAWSPSSPRTSNEEGGALRSGAEATQLAMRSISQSGDEEWAEASEGGRHRP